MKARTRRSSSQQRGQEQARETGGALAMARSAKPAADDKAVGAESTENDSSVEPIELRPDGYYWQAPDGRQEFGPFESYELAVADLHAGEESIASDETLPELEREFGIADWIDPQTGEPAEGQSPPHFEEP